MPVLASDTLVVKEVNGQVVKVHHRGASYEIQALTEANTYGTQPVDSGLAALINSRDTSAGQPTFCDWSRQLLLGRRIRSRGCRCPGDHFRSRRKLV